MEVYLIKYLKYTIVKKSKINKNKENLMQTEFFLINLF